MISKLFTFLLISICASAGGLIQIRGQVSKIEKGFAVFHLDGKDIRVSMKKLSKKEVKVVQEANGSKKEIMLKLSPQALVSEAE